MVPAHFKCTDASRNLTGYMSRPHGVAAAPLPMAPPPVPAARSSSSTDIVVPTVVHVKRPPPKAPPLVPFNIWPVQPRVFEVADSDSHGLLRGKASSSGFQTGMSTTK